MNYSNHDSSVLSVKYDDDDDDDDDDECGGHLVRETLGLNPTCAILCPRARRINLPWTPVCYSPGPRCSKLTISLVNDLLKFQT